MPTTSRTMGKSESVTFRIESEALRKLRREAGQKDISTNTLVNKLIKGHLNWHSHAAEAGFISVRRPFISKIIQYLPEPQWAQDYLAVILRILILYHQDVRL